MEYRIKLICLLLLVFHFGCENKPKIEMYDFYSALEPNIEIAEKSKDPIQLKFCTITPFNWDSIYVIPPYTSPGMVRDRGFTNSKQIEDMMHDLRFDEGKCVFLFIEDKKIVRYSIVPLLPLDITYLFDEWMSSNWITRQDACNNLYVVKEDNILKPFILKK